ncbi:GIY-YIG nuclease family protein [Leptolyngbya sp. CCNP1308]|uniref:GIY-YIG nuclease family protein n=1 Tax=Leptolyngbya sp. CCNP1308 TaxID=3110255 RepID=UPI003A599091
MISLSQLSLLPKTSGIYLVLHQDGTVLYVGQSQNLHQRWNGGHHKLAKLVVDYGNDICICWIELPEWLLNRAENAAFDFYKPALNLKSPPIV